MNRCIKMTTEEITDKLHLKKPDICKQKQCRRPYCNGVCHDESAVYVYPTCCNCGIELLDLIELMDCVDLRNQDFCEVCEKRYVNQSEFKTHFFSHFYRSSEKYEQKFYCVSCDHFLRNDVDVAVASDKNRKPCNICGSSYVHARDLIHHKYLKHGIREAPEQHFVCINCSRNFNTKNKLMAHTRECLSSEKGLRKDGLDCRICNEKFATRKIRLAHEIEMHRDKDTLKYHCMYCEMVYNLVNELNLHIARIHTKEKSYTCDICGKGFYVKHGLEIHALSHSDERPVKCELCGSFFKSHYARTKHEKNVHCTERRFKCDKCDKAYKDSTDLRRHRWTHGGYEKRFQCLLCDKKFYENKTLKYHMRSHEKTKRTVKKEIEFVDGSSNIQFIAATSVNSY